MVGRGVAAGVAMFFALAPAAFAGFPGGNGKIAFARHVPGGAHEIYTMNADGSDATRLTNDPGLDIDAAWSPDGAKLAFTSTRADTYDIYSMNADGSGVTRLTDHPSPDSDPAWSPDGTRLAFERGFDHQIYTMNADGSDPTNLTNSAGTSIDPAWSPDGTKIAFARNEDIYTINADGSDPVNLTDTPGTYEHAPAWSPDGSKIAFGTDAFADRDIYTINADGSGRTLVTLGGRNPAWSPDGTKIVFHSKRAGDFEVWTMNADGSGQINITNRQGQDWFADWQPLIETGYPRPQSAASLWASLVPSFVPCTAPNREHGPPLAEASCAPPVQQSARVTVGTADSNTGPADFSGLVRLNVLPGVPSTTTDEADVLIRAALANVRCRPPSTLCGSPNDFTTPADYAGALEGDVDMRITDRNNAPFPDPSTGTGPGTVLDQALTFTIPCTESSSTSHGSACSVETTADALVPGTVVEKQRANWELGDVRVLDGGADGDPGTADGAQVFLRQGVFIP